MQASAVDSAMPSAWLIHHHFAWHGWTLPPVDESRLLDYVVGANGVFARGRRPGLEVCMPVSFTFQPLRGLKEVGSYVQWGWPKVPKELVGRMLGSSRIACTFAPMERLFHLSFDAEYCAIGHLECANGWHVEIPEQEASDQHVKPLKTGIGSSTERAVIELHSHHSMPADFSPQDNEDEAQGFRVYSVIGNIFDKPQIRARVGLFGHFCEWPASEFFELPEGLNDCVIG